MLLQLKTEHLPATVSEPLPPASSMAASFTNFCCYKGFLSKISNIITNIKVNIEFKILSNGQSNPEATGNFFWKVVPTDLFLLPFHVGFMVAKAMEVLGRHLG